MYDLSCGALQFLTRGVVINIGGFGGGASALLQQQPQHQQQQQQQGFGVFFRLFVVETVMLGESVC